MPTISNALVPGEDEAREIHISGETIVAEATDDENFDAAGSILTPGFIDIQINGGFGHDFTQDPTTIWEVGKRLPELGVTAFVPTVVTAPREVTDLAIDVVTRRRPDDYSGAEVLGLHFEGPWISPEMHGAHNVDHITDPDPEEADKWVESGVVRIVTLAPERPGATDVGRLLDEGGVVVSIGHSNATFATAAEALATYAGLTTHLFNQMSPLSHREPGVVGASLISERPAVLIVDGLHISDGALELAWRLLGADRTVLVTDAMAALGLGPGTYPLGDGPITVGEDGPRTADGRLAGSVVTLAEAARGLSTATGASVAEALAAASINPARILGLRERGSLEPGSCAELTLLDGGLNPTAVVMQGELRTL